MSKRSSEQQPSVRDFFTKKPKVEPAGSSEAASSRPESSEKKKKPVLVILPGASGGFARDFREDLLPRLHSVFEVRCRPEGIPRLMFIIILILTHQKGKWVGWNPSSNAMSVAQALCPNSADAEPWFLMGCSFGNRVACSVVIDKKTPVEPGLILTGYPMYGPNGDEALTLFYDNFH